jgi:hypothetical protein
MDDPLTASRAGGAEAFRVVNFVSSQGADLVQQRFRLD